MIKYLLYKDGAGNKLWKKFIKSRNVWQYFGTNARDEILKKTDVKILINRARHSGITGLPTV